MGGQGDRHSAISPHLLVPLSPFPLRVSVPPWLFSCMQKSVTLTSLGNEPSPNITRLIISQDPLMRWVTLPCHTVE